MTQTQVKPLIPPLLGRRIRFWCQHYVFFCIFFFFFLGGSSWCQIQDSRQNNKYTPSTHLYPIRMMPASLPNALWFSIMFALLSHIKPVQMMILYRCLLVVSIRALCGRHRRMHWGWIMRCFLQWWSDIIEWIWRVGSVKLAMLFKHRNSMYKQFASNLHQGYWKRNLAETKLYGTTLCDGNMIERFYSFESRLFELLLFI